MPFGPNQINVGYGQSTNNPTGISNEVVPVNPAQTPANFVITGGSIDGTPIGLTTPAAASFTSIKDTSATANTLAYFDANKTLASATVGTGLSFSSGTLSSTVGGTVTSVDVSGGTTGLTTSGGPITSSGTITLAGTLNVANGGTGGTSASAARTNLGVTATGADTTYAYRANNLSDLASASTARTNLGLGGAATLNVGTTAGTVAAGDDSRITGAAQKANNLSDLSSAATARTNLGVTATGSDTTYAYRANNLSDLASASTARTNLGLGTVATKTAPSGTNAQLLANDGSGGFSNVTVGSGLSYSAGTLSASSGGGTVTSVSVVSANGLAGTVATATTTPAITLSTSVTGILKGNGTAISAATSGTDYEVPLTFSTGLTRTTNTVTVNSSQSISTLSNLTSNGFVKTSGGTGALSVDTNTYLTTTGNGSGLTGITATQVGLGNVTNDTQTKASIVPNTAPTAGQILAGNAGGTAYAPVSLSGSGATFSLSSAGVLTVSGIANASLTNSAITIAGTSTSLGGSITQDTITGLSTTGLVKRTAANTLAIATAGTDYLTTAVTSLAGTANEITASASTGSVTLSIPSAVTFTGKTITGGTYSSGAFNGTLGATTPSTVSATTVTASTTSAGGALIATYTPSTANDAAVMLTGKTTQGGAGYFDFLKATNSSTGATNPNKFFRLGSTGTLEIVNSAYGSVIWSLTDAGAQTVTSIQNTPIGSTTANTGAFTTLSASSTVSGTGFSTYLASPPAIGGTAAAAGSFTTLSASSTVSGTGFSNYLASPPAIGGTAAAAGTFTTLSDSIGNVRLVPQNSQSAAYTLVASDSGKHILHPSADTTARTFTIPANGSVAFAVGTAITFVNQASAGTLTIAITTDTMRLAGAGTTGSRTLAANGIATALKVTSTEWIISGTGLT